MPGTTTEEMKKGIFTILIAIAIGLLGCTKHELDPGIKQVDDQAIQSYISLHGITGMKRDTVGGDTSGIYYQVILPGIANTRYAYADSVDFVYTLRSFDGNYQSLDTNSVNHFENFAGHIFSANYPYGLQLVIHDVLTHGGAIRVLIPSHLAYGVNGYGSGSTKNVNSRIAGNQCLDYYIHAINNRATYDDQVIQTFFAASGITGYQRTADGLWYKVTTPPSAGAVAITDNTGVTMTYTAMQLNGTIFDQYNTTDGTGTEFDTPDVVAGMREGLEKFGGTGASLSLYIPSPLGYGKNAQSALPPNSIMHFEITILTTNP